MVQPLTVCAAQFAQRSDLQVLARLSLISSAIGQSREHSELTEQHLQNLEEHFPENIFRS